MRLRKLQPGTSPTAPDPVGSSTNKLHVLYVEDEDLNWQIALPSLRDKYEMSRARDAKEAMEAIKMGHFHCILMDIQLTDSEFDGIQITQILRGTYPGCIPDFAKSLPDWVVDVPIIFVTAYTARYSREDLVEGAGGSELMGKPVNFVALALTMSRIISAKVRTGTPPTSVVSA